MSHAECLADPHRDRPAQKRGFRNGPETEPRQTSYLTSAARWHEARTDAGTGGAGSATRSGASARDWYLLVVSYRHGTAQVGWSRAYLADQGTVPERSDVLVVSGVDHEMVSEMTKGTSRASMAPSDLRDVTINPAKELDRPKPFSGGGSVSPGLVEARLRLGHVLYRRGELADAARELQAAQAWPLRKPGNT